MRPVRPSLAIIAVLAGCGDLSGPDNEEPTVAARLVSHDQVEVSIANASRTTSWAVGTCPISGEELGPGGWQPSEGLGDKGDCLFPLVTIPPGRTFRVFTQYRGSLDGDLKLRVAVSVSRKPDSGSAAADDTRLIVSLPFRATVTE
jgi:hypothetical protein